MLVGCLTVALQTFELHRIQWKSELWPIKQRSKVISQKKNLPREWPEASTVKMLEQFVKRLRFVPWLRTNGQTNNTPRHKHSWADAQRWPKNWPTVSSLFNTSYNVDEITLLGSSDFIRAIKHPLAPKCSLKSIVSVFLPIRELNELPKGSIFINYLICARNSQEVNGQCPSAWWIAAL